MLCSFFFLSDIPANTPTNISEVLQLLYRTERTHVHIFYVYNNLRIQSTIYDINLFHARLKFEKCIQKFLAIQKLAAEEKT